MGADNLPIFKGIATALITPFKGNDIDFDTFGLLIDRQISAGISALVVCGTTGEASTLSTYEQLKCIEFAIERANGKVPIIGGTGSNCTKKAVELSKSASNLGCDALLIVTPYYNKTSPEGLIRHYSLIADSVSNPILLYNVPSRTGMNIPLFVYEKLSKHGNIMGVKEASGDISAVSSIRETCGKNFYIYSGNDDLILKTLQCGGCGAISVVSNIMPSETEDICKYYFSNDTKSAQISQDQLLDMIQVLFCEVNPIPIKCAMKLIGLCSGELRLPLCPASPSAREKIATTLKKYKLL